MASITLRTNISLVSRELLSKLQILKDRDYLLRPVAFDVLAMMTERIHQQGLDSKGMPIGSYSNSYLKLRQAKYKRSGDPKIIVSLTRQLENDWSVIPTQRGYGIGFLNPFNKQKMIWVEERKEKEIAALTENEQTYAINKLQQLVRDALSS